MQQEAKDKLSSEQRDALRFVSAASLRVHATPKQKAQATAVLPFGTIVAVQQRMGDWAFVIYKGRITEEEAEGWVLVRYLGKFAK